MAVTDPLAVAAAVRPHPNETVSGDAWSVRWHGNSCRIALVDGAGHGPIAEVAARQAINIFENNPSLDPEDLLVLCHRHLRGTRGAVMAVAVIDTQAKTLELAGVGNIEARLLMNGREQHPLSQRGLLGSNIPTVRPFSTQLAPDWVFALHSDGVRSRWNIQDLTNRSSSAQTLASQILAEYSRADDDACVVVVRPLHLTGTNPDG